MSASSLLASYYPRYYGYYEKAIGIYTHVSDQYSVFSTKVISCGPREALYVLDGLLENNTILPIKFHTTDTHGYTEIIFALCYLLGYYFMPRIRDFKDQQLYRIDKSQNHGVFAPLLTKSVLYWNTINISNTVDGLRKRDEIIEDETLSHISLLPYKHVIPNGSYFIEDFQRGF